MAEPKMGDRDTCKQCGKPIEYVGSYWRHVDGKYRHVAKPATEKDKTSDS